MNLKVCASLRFVISELLWVWLDFNCGMYLVPLLCDRIDRVLNELQRIKEDLKNEEKKNDKAR